MTERNTKSDSVSSSLVVGPSGASFNLFPKQRELFDRAERKRVLDELWSEVLQEIHDGTNCPLCGHGLKVYKRHMTDDRCHWLTALVLKYLKEARYYHKDEVINSAAMSRMAGEYAKLEFWDLIVQQMNYDNPKLPRRYSGMWRPTEAGIDFALRRLTVPSYVLVFQNKRIGASEHLVSITDCWGEYFDFREAWGE